MSSASQNGEQIYNQQFNLVGFSDILSGFKHWYDVANTKLKSFVKGPIKMLSTNPDSSVKARENPGNGSANASSNVSQVSSNQNSLYSSLVTSK